MTRDFWMTGGAWVPLMVAAVAGGWPADLQAQTAQFDIPAGPLEVSLQTLAVQSSDQLLFDPAITEGLSGPAVRGRLTTEAALSRLLAGTALEASRTGEGVYVVRRRQRADTDEARVADIVVTGSLIRGVVDGPSPVVVISRDAIDRSGRATVAQALQALPQNFGGMASEEASANQADRSGSNTSQASGVNLRGLGADATLVLVNGRRIGGTGTKGDYADLSSIPTSAVERVDVLLDGGSALYGADAIGGVVNVILRDDYDGQETRLRFGSATDGATEEIQLGQTFGRRWDTGNILASYEYYARDNLAVADRRAFAGDADHRPLGGRDRRQNFSNPANIVVLDQARGGYVSLFAVPRGQNGTALRPQDFRAGESNLTNQRQGMNALPRQERHALFVAGSQRLGERLELSADTRWGWRDFSTVQPPFATVFTVTRANPFFVSPTGAASHTLAYSFGADLPNTRSSGKAETEAYTLGADLELGGDWRVEAYGAFAAESLASRTDGSVNSTALREALGAIADDPRTPYSAARDGFFNPFADGSNSSAAALAFIGSGYGRNRSGTDVSTAQVQLGGTLLSLPGGPVRLAAGLAWRRETFRTQITSFTSGVVPTVGAPVENSRDVGAAFAELRVPLFGPDNARPGFQRLDLSLAARFEDYESVGETTSPKVGVVWKPVDSLLLRANYGRSFRAPALIELTDAPSASPTILPRGSQQILSMILYGGNPDLEPETATTWTLGGEFQPGAVPGLRLGLNAFRIDFENRIGQPTFENILSALSDPAFGAFVRTIDVANAADVAAVQDILDRPTTGLRDLFPATAYGAIVDARFVNTASVLLEGIDANLGYGFDRGPDRFDLAANLSWLSRFDSRATPDSAVVSQLDMPNFPVSLRGRATVDWRRDAWGATAALNYVDRYSDLDGRAISAWTTADLQVRYAPDAGPWAGSTVQFGVQNLFDADPPFYDASSGVAYDAANASVLGRFASIAVTRTW